MAARSQYMYSVYPGTETKYDEDALFSCFCNNIDIVGLFEAWLTRTGANDMFYPDLLMLIIYD